MYPLTELILDYHPSTLLNAYLTIGCNLLTLPCGAIIEFRPSQAIISSIYGLNAFTMNETFKQWLEEISLHQQFRYCIFHEKKCLGVDKQTGAPIQLGCLLGAPIFMQHQIFGVVLFGSIQKMQRTFEPHHFEMVKIIAESLTRLITLQKKIKSHP